MNNFQPILVSVDRVSDMIGKCRRSVYQLIATDKLEAVQGWPQHFGRLRFSEAVRRESAARTVQAVSKPSQADQHLTLDEAKWASHSGG
jgi:hypothetical protein